MFGYQVSSDPVSMVHGLGARSQEASVLPVLAGGTQTVPRWQLAPSTGAVPSRFRFPRHMPLFRSFLACGLRMTASGQSWLAARGGKQVNCRPDARSTSPLDAAPCPLPPHVVSRVATPLCPWSLIDDHLHTPLPPSILSFVSATLCLVPCVLWSPSSQLLSRASVQGRRPDPIAQIQKRLRSL